MVRWAGGVFGFGESLQLKPDCDRPIIQVYKHQVSTLFSRRADTVLCHGPLDAPLWCLSLRGSVTIKDNMDAKKALPSSTLSPQEWRKAFEAALLERDHAVLPRRLRDAKNAVMDRIEDSLDSASLHERKLLLATLNTISELERLAQVDELSSADTMHVLPDIA
jgi:hypothetical protein